MKATQMTRTQQKRKRLADTERRFRKACEQIVQIDHQAKHTQYRYYAAKAANLTTFRYSLQIRLAAEDGMREMYWEYAHKKAAEIKDLKYELADNHPFIYDADQ